MNLFIKLLASLLLLVAAILVPSAQAQMAFGRQWDTNVDLTQADIDMARAVVAQKIRGRQPGASGTWSNPASGNSGTITLMRVFSRNGQRCEQIDYQVSAAGPGKPSDRYDFVSCLQPDGAWKLAY